MDMGLVINIEASKRDNRALIMPHQQDAVDALNTYFDLSGESLKAQSGLLVMPTGSGKTFTTVNWLINSGIANGYKVVWLAHRQELIDQTYNEFKKQSPLLRNYGIDRLGIIPVSGAHFMMSQASRMDVNICSIQSIANSYGYRFIKRMLGAHGTKNLIVVVDEAHHAVSGSYKKVLDRITAINPYRILLGLTATPTRMQEQERNRLHEIFCAKNGYIYQIKLKDLLMNGYLAKPIYQRVNTNIIGEVEYMMTKFDQEHFEKFDELSEVMKERIGRSSARNQIILKQYLDKRLQYGKTLIFAVNKYHAQTLYMEFMEAGVSCEYVVAGKPGIQEIISAFKKNKFTVLINVQILTEGSDIPDVQTVFLTRETNSDVLLMQMIGRGLRGVAAGGTKELYIVDFHDTWNVLAFWLDPRRLDVFESEETSEQTETKMINDNMAVKSEVVALPNKDLDEFYLQISKAMRSYVTVETATAKLPCGWYSIINEDKLNDIVLVFDNQVEGYRELEKRCKAYVQSKYNALRVSQLLFPNSEDSPSEYDIQTILKMIYETGKMPDYFTFEQRDQVSVYEIVRKMNNVPMSESQKDYWLKDMYDDTPIIREIYKNFYMFKHSVYQADKERIESEISILDVREEYDVIPDYYDLEELLNEVVLENPDLNKKGLTSITWSIKTVRSWFGRCLKWQRGDNSYEYDIQLNRLLSSPSVSREVVKYLIYHEMLHKNGLWNHDIVFREKEWAYPNSEELDGFLDEMTLRYKLEIPLRREERVKRPEGFQYANEGPINSTGNICPVEKIQAPGIKEGYKYCRDCGNQLPTSARFCDRCGSSTNYEVQVN